MLSDPKETPRSGVKKVLYVGTMQKRRMEKRNNKNTSMPFYLVAMKWRTEGEGG